MITFSSYMIFKIYIYTFFAWLADQKTLGNFLIRPRLKIENNYHQKKQKVVWCFYEWLYLPTGLSMGLERKLSKQTMFHLRPVLWPYRSDRKRNGHHIIIGCLFWLAYEGMWMGKRKKSNFSKRSICCWPQWNRHRICCPSRLVSNWNRAWKGPHRSGLLPTTVCLMDRRDKTTRQVKEQVNMERTSGIWKGQPDSFPSASSAAASSIENRAHCFQFLFIFKSEKPHGNQTLVWLSCCTFFPLFWIRKICENINVTTKMIFFFSCINHMTVPSALARSLQPQSL